MIDYLVLPRLKVRQANIYNAAFLIGGPPVLAAWFMAHALGRRLDQADAVRSLAFVLHSLTPLGEKGENEYNLFCPQLRRGAAYTFDKKGSDYSSHNNQALSLQPVACAHMEVSLVIGIRDLSGLENIPPLVRGGRLAGGLITDMGKPDANADIFEALESIRSGYLVMDRRDLMEQGEGNRAERLVAALGHEPTKDDGMSWLSAACLGYAAISPFAQRAGAREGYPHAFAEPLIGLVQYRSLRQCLDEGLAEQALWRPQWVADDVFRIYQKTA